MDQAKSKIVFPRITCVALWHCEVTGQLSDGTWENSSPHDHWKFWSKLEAVVGGEPGIIMRAGGFMKYNQRRKYNIVGLMNSKWSDDDMARFNYTEADRYILRGRMLAYGRMALALQKLGRPLDLTLCRHAEYMPAEHYSFRASRASGIWKYDFVGGYLDPVDDVLARAFYETSYSEDCLRQDLEAVSDAMRLDPVRRDSLPPTNGVVAV